MTNKKQQRESKPKDLALLKDPAFKEHVETYAKDQDVGRVGRVGLDLSYDK